MTGSGTENDPYICTKLSEIISVQANTSPYIKIPTNTLIDANDEYPEGFTTAIYICSHIDGQGSTIRNIASTAQEVFNCDGADFQNLNLLNIRGKKHLFRRTNTNSPCQLYNCKFSGRMDALSSMLYHYAGSVRRCSFNFEVYGSSSAQLSWWDSYDGFIIEYNRFEFDCSHMTDTGGFRVEGVSNCYITGNHPAKIVVDGNTNVVDFTAPTANVGNNVSNILINSDKCATIPEQAGVFPVTTAQMKDAAYLASLGFPIQT